MRSTRSSIRVTGVLLGTIACLAIFANLGCDTTKFATNGMSDGFLRGSPAVEQHWDYDLVGQAMPNNLIQLEGFLRIVPENEIFLLQAMRGYVSYGYGWLEDRAETHDLVGEYEEAAVLRGRAKLLYLRARDLGKHWIGLHHEGMEDALAGDIEGFEQWLQGIDDPEQVPMLLWTGYAWGSYINVAKDDMEAVADLAYAQALVERAVELDEPYYHAAGVTFLAVVNTSALGADLDAAQQLWERSLELTERHNLLVLVNMAKLYAVKRQDRALYISLLREVLEAGDVLPEARLGNRIARRRAARYLTQVDDLFPEDG